VVLLVDRRGRARARHLLPEDLLMQLLQLRTRLETELVNERAPRGVVRVERLGLAARVVEREHQLDAQPLPQRVLPDERLQLGDELGVATAGELRVDPVLEHCEAELLEPPHLGGCEELERDVREGLAAPEVERRAQRP